ncbi:MAG: trypsin-like peptidase domain-containing protein [Anaerolineae bacterium]|nr:trypsin-like peptidase domain-containing protein [Anaerolineae bacterium]
MPIQREIDAALYELQHGRTEVARDRLRRLIRQANLLPEQRARAWVTLSDSFFTSVEKRACLMMALDLDPHNVEASRRLGRTTMPPPPGMAPPKPTAPLSGTPRAAKTNLNGYFPVLGISGGPHGDGSGFFVSGSGLVVTTRHVVGSCTTVSVVLAPQRQLQGTVVWSSPALDLALIDTPHTVSNLLDVNSGAQILPDQFITIHGYGQTPLQGRCVAAADGERWFGTDVSSLRDAGGGPITNRDNAVVGIATRNEPRAGGGLFGAVLVQLKPYVDRVETRLADGLPRRYCPSCGNSAWVELNAQYCRFCGAAFDETWMR